MYQCLCLCECCIVVVRLLHFSHYMYILTPVHCNTTCTCTCTCRHHLISYICIISNEFLLWCSHLHILHVVRCSLQSGELSLPDALTVYLANSVGRQDLNCGDKIILSPFILMACEQKEMEYPMVSFWAGGGGGVGGVCYTCSLRGRGMCIRGRQGRVSAWGKKDSTYHVLVKSHCERSFCAFQTQCTCTLHVCTNYMYTI